MPEVDLSKLQNHNLVLEIELNHRDLCVKRLMMEPHGSYKQDALYVLHYQNWLVATVEKYLLN